MAELPSSTVTFLFTDIEGSTRLWEQHPEPMRAALARHDALAAAVIDQHAGTLVKSRGEGDSLFAVFARPTDALAAACALQQALVAEPWPVETPLRVRLALHTGEADQRGGDFYGAAVNRCARLRSIAHGGQVLLSQAIADPVREHLPAGTSLRDLGSHRLKDLQQPEHLYQLLHPALPADFPPLRSLEAFAHNLPRQLTNFIGREKEMAEVKQLLATTSLLTLTGSGGCGKTRLALQVAAEVLETYAEGVWLVELAALADPALVPQTVATALGLREEPGRPLTATLADYLRARSLLLVLDNCEHLLAASAQLTDTLLRAAPHLRVLTSSREGLGIAGELTYRVPSLSLPDPRSVPLAERLAEYEAVRLFLDRARFSRPGFSLTRENAAAVAQVCQRLDGIPLAIELAAARVKALSVEQIAARLDDRFRLLTGGSRTALPRQQTLRALIDWSYDLLFEPERTLLRRLSVFAGGWTLEAAEAVCTSKDLEAWEVLDLLTTLVEKSLVVYEEQDEPRYRLLETVRQYARDRLLEAGEGEAVRQRHLRFFLRWAEEVEPKLRSEQVAWLERLEKEHDNLRTALEWCNTGENGGEARLRLASAMFGFWWMRGHLSEGREQFADALSGTEVLGPTAARATALNLAGRLLRLFGDYAAARALHEEALAISRTLVDMKGIASSLDQLGTVAHYEGNYGSARLLLEEGLSIWRELGDRQGIAGSLLSLGTLAYLQGDYGPARALLEESLAFFREVNNKGNVAYLLNFLGNVARAEGNYPLARSFYEEDLALVRELGHKFGMQGVLDAFAQLAAAEGQPKRAARLMGAAEALREALHTPVPYSWRADHDRAVAVARAALGEAVFAAAWAEGQALSLEAAVACALEEGQA
jgi:predicted ATPase/class 3 adenylate cyclase